MLIVASLSAIHMDRSDSRAGPVFVPAYTVTLTIGGHDVALSFGEAEARALVDSVGYSFDDLRQEFLARLVSGGRP